MRLIVYGDIHGCLDELVALRKKIKITKNDIEVTVGDFINKGPKALETLKYIRKNSIMSVLGNHEDLIRRYYETRNKKLLNNQQYKTANDMSYQDIQYLKSLPIYRKIGKVTILHGGVSKQVSLKNLDTTNYHQVITMRYIDKDGNYVRSDKATKDYQFWSEDYDGYDGFIIYGHTPMNKPKIQKHSIGIDTGCVYGKKLTAILITDYHTKPTYKFVAVKAQKKYA